MPQIPTLDNQVRPRGGAQLPGASAREHVAQSIGAGLSDAGNVAARIQHVEQLKADRAAFMDADRQTDSVANALVTRAQSLQGKDAIGSAPQLLEEFDKAATQTAPGSQARARGWPFRNP
jgi:hypothetical protein